ncbi:MAG: phenylalanine--tRNA ligase subunit alpha [Nanoarchaeota archaeon]
MNSELIDSLHPLERKIIPLITQNMNFNTLLEKTGMGEVESLRALQWLEKKKALILHRDVIEVISLGKNGKEYLQQGLPERKFLKVLLTPLLLTDVQTKINLSKEELNVSLGVLKRRKLIDLEKGKASITQQGKNFFKKDFPEEIFLKSLPTETKNLKEEELSIFKELLERKDILQVDIRKVRKIELTDIGKQLQAQKLDNVMNKLTPSMLKTGSWKNTILRPYDLEQDVGKRHYGKRHFVNQSIAYARRVWLDMGFKEMTGTYTQTSFWNFDALFTAQDHPVRDLQDTFYIEHPSNGKLPNKQLVNSIKKVHEYGGNTKSLGWRYKWDPKAASRNVLRTHTTCLSAKTLYSLRNSNSSAKFFALGKNFRNETIDWGHLFEFNQTEGIVIDPSANFRDLLGYLKQFMKKMGYKKVRFRPAYFPYTFCSTEFDVFHPVHKKWIELGGAGMLRPEVVIPLLGKDIPVLAWGPGFDRIMTDYYKINDLRDIYKNDIKQLRETKVWLK